METPATTTGLPDNAYKELKEGETYRPIMDPEKSHPEVTGWSVGWGLVMAVLFSAAAAYSGLKIGQVFEAAIPIAILAVGLSAAFKKKNALGQNVIIQSIGACSGVIVAGAIFTIPALYILDLPASFYQVFLASMLGGFLGILFLIPFRKFFVKDMHGKFPFPEATATTEILVAGEKGGKQAAVLIVAGFIGGIFDFVFSAFGYWSEVITSRMFSYGQILADRLKLVAKLDVSAMVFGLGYIVGLRYSAIIAAGSFLSWFVLIPLFNEVGQSLTVPLGATATKLIANMSAEEIFRAYVRQIGIGGIAMAGIIGILRSSKIIAGAFKLAYNEIFKRQSGPLETAVRWQTDLRMNFVVLLILLTGLLIFVFFFGGVVFNFTYAIVGLLIVVIVSFLFTTVAANAIAIVGTNPVSGMTLMTLILSSFILVRIGLSGAFGNGERSYYWRSRVYGAFRCGRIHYRPEDRLLARVDAQETGNLEISGSTGIGRNSRRRDSDPQRHVWIQRTPRHGCPAGQCHGGRYPASHVECSRAVDSLPRRRGDRVDPDNDQHSASGICARYVHSTGTERSTRVRRIGRLVGNNKVKERKIEQREIFQGDIDRIRIHCRWIALWRG
jgi:hypothetical protein